jgi:hypothetical protein
VNIGAFSAQFQWKGVENEKFSSSRENDSRTILRSAKHTSRSEKMKIFDSRCEAKPKAIFSAAYENLGGSKPKNKFMTRSHNYCIIVIIVKSCKDEKKKAKTNDLRFR